MRTDVDAASLRISAQRGETAAAETFVRLLEEMLDLKIQQDVESRMKCPPEIAQVMQAKRQTDQRRLDQIRAELVRLIQA
jgi:hypothetical protein